MVAVFFLGPVPQDPSYHEFADTRSILGIPNFWNVVSNFPFLLVGGLGFYYLRSINQPGILPDLHLAYVVFFAGILLTGLGSAYYHYAPDNATLIWDRLAMTLGFMGLITIIIGEHISLPAAKRLLIPLVIVGAGSVVYWGITEARGSGDLRPYGIVQFLPMLLMPLILLLYRSVFNRVSFYWFVMALYVLSKLFEHFDFDVYGFGELISGHSLKHVVAAVAPLVLLHGFYSRQPRSEVSAM
ncbi:MAG: alkaline phytoceramidase [Proteobacteria bacterium]|nr:alkaline phytoceramidase [Pseudomonadota bacterium]MCH8227506.1 alkaline phytoceramidase [Pseudomonadota bacterium]